MKKIRNILSVVALMLSVSVGFAANVQPKEDAVYDSVVTESHNLDLVHAIINVEAPAMLSTDSSKMVIVIYGDSTHEVAALLADRYGAENIKIGSDTLIGLTNYKTDTIITLCKASDEYGLSYSNKLTNVSIHSNRIAKKWVYQN